MAVQNPFQNRSNQFNGIPRLSLFPLLSKLIKTIADDTSDFYAIRCRIPFDIKKSFGDTKGVIGIHVW